MTAEDITDADVLLDLVDQLREARHAYAKARRLVGRSHEGTRHRTNLVAARDLLQRQVSRQLAEVNRHVSRMTAPPRLKGVD